MIIELTFLILLIVINGLFSASEIAFLSININTIDAKPKDRSYIKIKKLLGDTSGFLATIQIGITLAGFLASAFASETFADYIVENIHQTFINATLFKSIIVFLVTIILSYFTLVFGELIPKRVGLAYPEKVARLMAGPIYILMKIAYPFVLLLKYSTNIVCKAFKIKEKSEEAVSEEEIKIIIDKSTKSGKIEKGEKELIYKVFEFNDTTVKNVMTKKENVITISESLDIRGVVDCIKKYKYTRFPVCDAEDETRIIGILNVKDMLLRCTDKNSIQNFALVNLIRKPLYIYCDEKVDDVFRVMQSTKINMAIVCDKNKYFVGIVTIEDLLEELVGNISDEFI